MGSYAMGNRFFDVGVMLCFGVVGFGMERLRVPLSPFVIGFVLAPIAESNLGAALMSSGGTYRPFVSPSEHPLSCTFLTVAIAIVLWSVSRRAEGTHAR